MGLFSSIMGKFGEADQLKKKLEDPNMKDALKRKELASALEGAQKRGFGENVMGGMKDHFMGKAGNLGFGEGGFSMQTMMDAQKARAEGSPAVPPVTQMAAPSITPVTATAPGAQPMMPKVPTMGGVGPSPAMQQIQAAQQQYAMYGMPQQYPSYGLIPALEMPPTHSATGALNVPPGYESKGKKLLSALLMGGMGG